MRGLIRTFSLMIMTIQISYASAHVQPCAPISVKAQNKNILLPGALDRGKAQVYFLHNTSKHSLWLDRYSEKSQSAHAGWSSYLRPGKWSAIWLNSQNFVLSCAVIRPGKVDYQACIKNIAVCHPSLISFKGKSQSSYWLTEDKSYEELEKALGKRGVVVKIHE